MKHIIFFIPLFIFFINSYNPNDIQDESINDLKITNSFSKNENLVIISYENITYKALLEKNELEKIIDGKFAYYFESPEIDKNDFDLSFIGSKWTDGISITNKSTNEKTLMENIRQEEEGFYFDLKDDENILKDLYFNTNNLLDDNYKTNGLGNWFKEIGKAIKNFVVKIKADLTYNECTSIVEAFGDCSNGSKKHVIKTSDGDCEVWCK